MARNYGSSAGTYRDYADRASFDVSRISVHARVWLNSAPASEQHWISRWSGLAGGAWALGFNINAVTNGYGFYVGISGSGLRRAAGLSMSTGQWYSIVGVYNQANALVYLDGTLTTGDAATNAMSALALPIRVAEAAGGTARHGDVRIAELAVWSTDITQAEVTSLASGYSPLSIRPQSLILYDPQFDPVAIVGGTASDSGSPSATDHPLVLRASGRSMVFMPSAGGAFTLSCDAGSYGVTGSAATLLVGRRLSGDPGSYTVTGADASLRVGHVLVTDAGAYAITGSAASLLHGRSLTADPGSYVVTGVDAGLRKGYVISTDAGIYTLNGADADLVKTGSVTLTADPGVYAITGFDAILRVHRALTADPGSYAVTGSPVTNLRGYVLTADPGDYDLTGVDATLIASGDYSITAEPGSYTITGVDATLLVHRLLTAAPGSYTVTGLPATLNRTHFVPAYVVQTDLIRRMRRAAHVNQEARWLFHRALQIDLEAGVGLVTGQGSDPQIMLRWSDDGGQTWSTEHWTSAGRLGEYQRRAIWRRLGRARDRVYEIAVSDPIAWHQLAAILDIEEGTS